MQSKDKTAFLAHLALQKYGIRPTDFAAWSKREKAFFAASEMLAEEKGREANYGR